MKRSFDIERNLTLVMSASVDPKGMPGVTRADPIVRENDYATALEYYLTHHPRVRRVVLADNSDWPLDRLRQVAGSIKHDKQVEIISVGGGDFPRELGKAYGEMRLMQLALEQSQLVREGTHVAKVTGRLRLMNMTTIIERTRKPFELLCDVRDHGMYKLIGWNRRMQISDSRFVVFTPGFFERRVVPRIPILSDAAGYLTENLFHDLSMREPAGEAVVPRFPVEPDFRGVAAHAGPPQRIAALKRRIRSIARRVTPWLYI